MNETFPGLADRVAALERRVMELTQDQEFEKNDLPWREPTVQRAARECDHPMATATNEDGWLKIPYEGPWPWPEEIRGPGAYTHPRTAAIQYHGGFVHVKLSEVRGTT